MELYLLSFAFFVLQLIDWYTTRTILKAGGYEQNPVMVFVFKYINVNVAMGVKTVILSALGYFVGQVYPIILVGFILYYSWVAYHNWKSL